MIYEITIGYKSIAEDGDGASLTYLSFVPDMEECFVEAPSITILKEETKKTIINYLTRFSLDEVEEILKNQKPPAELTEIEEFADLNWLSLEIEQSEIINQISCVFKIELSMNTRKQLYEYLDGQGVTLDVFCKNIIEREIESITNSSH